jgi:hypothetical protein
MTSGSGPGETTFWISRESATAGHAVCSRLCMEKTPMKRLILALVAALLLTGCAVHRDLRTQSELDRDAEIWTRAHAVRVTTAPGQVDGCSSLGVVNDRYYEGPAVDPMKRPMGGTWAEYMLRFKTARRGGNAAVMSSAIDKWTGRLDQSRVLGEAYLCGQPAFTTASQ